MQRNVIGVKICWHTDMEQRIRFAASHVTSRDSSLIDPLCAPAGSYPMEFYCELCLTDISRYPTYRLELEQIKQKYQFLQL